MEFVSKMTRYSLSLIPDNRIIINGYPVHKKGVYVSFKPSNDGRTSYFNTQDWQLTNAKSEKQLIDLMNGHPALNGNYWMVREPEPVSKKKVSKKEELVTA